MHNTLIILGQDKSNRMESPLYDVYFTGNLVEGADPQTARAGFMQLFKASPETADKFFNGKPQLLKRGVSKEEALKYKAVLHKAGMMLAFKAHQDASAAAPAAPVTAPPSATTTAPEVVPTPAPAQTAADGEWSIAPAGSDVLRPEERHQQPEREIDTSNIKLASAFSAIEPEREPPPPPPDTSHITAAQAGEDLLPEKPAAPPPLEFDLDAITLAPPGTELEELKEELELLDPDISALSLAEVGVDLLEGQQKPTDPAPPNTDHLKVMDGD